MAPENVTKRGNAYTRPVFPELIYVLHYFPTDRNYVNTKPVTRNFSYIKLSIMNLIKQCVAAFLSKFRRNSRDDFDKARKWRYM